MLCPPHLHLTTSKVMVIIWRLIGNIIITFFIYCQRATSSMVQLTKTVHTAWLGLEFVFLCFFKLHDLSLCWCMFSFTLTLESFPFMFWRWRNKIKWAPFELFASSHLRAIVNKKQCETRGLLMSLVIRYWIGDVQDSQGVSISQNANCNF